MAPLYELRRWTLPYQLYLHIKEKMERQHGNIGGLRRRMSGLIFPMTTVSLPYSFLEMSPNSEQC